MPRCPFIGTLVRGELKGLIFLGKEKIADGQNLGLIVTEHDASEKMCRTKVVGAFVRFLLHGIIVIGYRDAI